MVKPGDNGGPQAPGDAATKTAKDVKQPPTKAPSETPAHQQPPAVARVTWKNTISHMFTQLDIGCMRDVAHFKPRLDLGDYDSVVLYRVNIYYALKSGVMPPGGPRWSEEKLELFRQWMQQKPPPKA